MIGVVKSKQRDVAFFVILKIFIMGEKDAVFRFRLSDQQTIERIQITHRFVRPNFQAMDSQNMRREDVHRLKPRTQAVPQDKDIIA